MNIFLLDWDPVVCAQQHSKSHLTKMPLETAQLLSTTKQVLGMKGPLKATHQNHPSRIWTGESAANYDFVYNLFLALLDEFRFRRKKDHSYISLVHELARDWDESQHQKIGPTKFRLAIKNTELHDPDPVVAYRNYYKTEKRHLADWECRNKPDWWT